MDSEFQGDWAKAWIRKVKLKELTNIDPELNEEIRISVKIKKWQNMTLNELSSGRGDKKYMIQVAIQDFIEQVDIFSRAIEFMEDKLPVAIREGVAEAFDTFTGIDLIEDLTNTVAQSLDLVRAENEDITGWIEIQQITRKLNMLYLIALGRKPSTGSFSTVALAKLIEEGYVELLPDGSYSVVAVRADEQSP